jgi:hypothetical protein
MTHRVTGDVFSSETGRYLAHRTDFRSVLAEIFRRHFGTFSGDDDR